MNMVLLWTVLAIVFGLLEAATAGLVSLWFIFGAMAAAIAAALGWHWGVQLGFFLAVSILILVFLRPILSRHVKPKIQPTNADALLGKTAVVTVPIDNVQGGGQVKVGGAIWSALSTDDSVLESDTPVIIQEIRGVKLVVSKKEEV